MSTKKSNRRNHRCRMNNNEEFTKESEIFYVHELVAQTFVPNPHNYPYVEHIDGNKLNNHADNLRWTNIMPEGYMGRNIK
jgi:hypothetical protein